MKAISAPATTNAVENGTVRALFLSSFLDHSSCPAFEKSVILRRAGIASETLKSPYSWLPLRQYIAVTEQLADRSHNENLGLEVGKRFTPEDFGPFYMLIASSGTLGAMIETFMRFQRHWQTQTHFEIHRNEDLVEIRYMIRDRDLWPRRQDAEFTLSTLNTCIWHIVGHKGRPVEVLFEHDVAGRERFFRDIFECKVRGDQDRNAMVFPQTTLDLPLRISANPDFARLHSMFESHLSHLLRPVETLPGSDIVDQIRWIVSTRIGEVDCPFHEVANELGIAERTLRRHLAAQDVKFRDLVLQQRMKRACQLLESRANISLSDLAEKVGYSSTAAFARAFKNYHGTSPRQFIRKPG